MSEKATDKCKHCNNNLIEGSLEGVSFLPASEEKKWLSSGIYGVRAFVCIECGYISEMFIDVKRLHDIINKADIRKG